ncbi:MAG: ribonuclease P protein subunit [Candidatus Thermoplasmatota archaeon]|jgi:RNase P/RNase MRP subunit p29|nr:ribonuclease P protein subunit [Candidatus Thermoplasmatota archaeon]MCL5962999.1 ribonuclease P protein subunit [Candidatus Thermoplasmatota archaeon]
MNAIKDIEAHELIGMRVKIYESKCLTYMNLSGIIMDETKNMIQIKKDDDKTVWLSKKKVAISYFIDNEYRKVGSIPAYRPEERTKRVLYGKTKHRI